MVLSRRNHEATMLLCTLVLSSVLASAHAPWAFGAVFSRNVDIVVNPALYSSGQITGSLTQYMQDIRRQGYNPVLTTASFTTAADLRNHLSTEYATTGLAGAVFVGNLPVATYHVDARPDAGFPAEDFPCDYYYEDLAGTWSDTNSNGVLDSLTGTTSPQIWMGRMTVAPLTGLQSGRTESGMLNSYFARDHAYRAKQLSLSTNGLAYIDDDWNIYGWDKNMQLGVSGTVTAVTDGATTTAADYKNRLKTQYEQVLLCAHSAATYHQFKIGTAWSGGSVSSSELQSMNPQTFFYNLFACSNADYTQSNYMAGEYAFGTSMGLLAVGSTKTGGMLNYQNYYDPLGQGKTFGDAWKNWFATESAGGFTSDGVLWDFGMTMLGDPLLMTQAWRNELNGDVNGDGVVNAADIDAVYAHVGSGILTYDVNGDGVVNKSDADFLVKTILHSSYGNANLDGFVDFMDFQTLLDHWTHSGAWADGDFDGNGRVDFADFQLLLDNWSPLGNSSVPEPATLIILSLGAISILRPRRNA